MGTGLTSLFVSMFSNVSCQLEVLWMSYINASTTSVGIMMFFNLKELVQVWWRCNFYRDFCFKDYCTEDFDNFSEEHCKYFVLTQNAITLCRLEIVFPPSSFVVMVYLPYNSHEKPTFVDPFNIDGWTLLRGNYSHI